MHQQTKLRIGLAGTSHPKRRGREVSLDLAQGLERLGYEIADDKNFEVLINVNHNWNAISEIELLETGRAPLKILIRVEPPSVYPNQYTYAVESKYDMLLSPGNINSDEENFLRWPYAYHLNPSAPSATTTSVREVLRTNMGSGVYSYENWITRPITFSMIAANKISPNGTGNYALRRKLASYDSSDFLQVYGALWNASLRAKLRYRFGVLKFAVESKSDYQIQSIFHGLSQRFKNAIGQVYDKHSIILNSKFSVVVENSDDYVSEKLLDAIMGGSIPIYYGPNLSKTGIPEDLVVRCSREHPELHRVQSAFTRQKVEEWLEKVSLFLNGAEFRMWEAEKVHAEICARIDSMIRAGQTSC